MDTLRGIFPQAQPPPKRDFLKENVMRIRNMQRMRKPTKDTEYLSKFSKPIKPPRKFSLSENNIPGAQRSTHSLALCSTKAPLNNLRKSISSMSIQNHKEIGTQTSNPNDDFFLKDSIIRYPSASTIRSSASMRPPSAHQTQPLSHQTQTCSRGHQLEPSDEPARPRFRSHFHERKDEHCDNRERQITNLSEFLEKGAVSKKQPTSILKTSSSTASQKSSKDYINELQQRKVDRVQKPDEVVMYQPIEISDDEEDVQKEKRSPSEKELGCGDAKKKAIEEDPDCPDGHMLLPEIERQEALKLAEKRKFCSRDICVNRNQYFILGFKELVDDLNRLPMTCETLRVRNRKIEIEKELRALEINIRVFNRRKVYVKLD